MPILQSPFCAGARIVEPKLKTILITEQHSVSRESVVLAANAVYPQGSILFKPRATAREGATWSVIPATAPDFVANEYAILLHAVDTTVCTPPVPGKGVVVTSNAVVNAPALAYPAAMTQADRATLLQKFAEEVSIKSTRWQV